MEELARSFEEQRDHLRGVAYRMLGSRAEAEDAVQEAWLRLSRSDTSEVANLAGWLTTVVSRVCLDMLRSRKSRREDSLEDTYVPDPVSLRAAPEDHALEADAVGLALLVVLETLAPAERLAFVLHDMFGLSFDEVAEVVGRSPAAARQLASRARRRVQGAPANDGDPSRQRQIVDAFLAASRNGDFEGLLVLLDPNVVLRADAGTNDTGPAVSKVVRGALTVVEQALMFTRLAPYTEPALINGTPGTVTVVNGRIQSVMAFTVTDGKITELNILADPTRLAALTVER